MQHCNHRVPINRLALLAFAAGVSVVWLNPVPVRGIGQEFTPLEHWSYRAIERFESLGMCNVPDDKPFTRTEFIAIVNQIKENAFDRRLAARDRYELARLEKEYSDFASQRDPQARYDPPTFFVQERPITLEMDLDLAGIASKPLLDEFGTEYFLNSNPSVKLHYSDHLTYDVRYVLTMGPENGDRARNEKPSERQRSFKGLTSLYERSYVILGGQSAHVFLGREYIDWGPSDWYGLITPGASVGIDQLGWRAKLRWFRFSMFHGTLSPELERKIAGHRLEMRFDRVTIGLNETVVYAGRGWEPIYFFPLSSFYANQFNERDNDDNILWSGDVKVSFLDALTVYAGGLLDDYQFERDGNQPDKYAFEIGGRFAMSNPIASTWRVRYHRVEIYTYTHQDTLTYYLSGDADPELSVLLGGQPGPDADALRIEGQFYPRDNVILTGAVFSQRLGEGNDMRPFVPGEPVNPPFPSGVVEKALGFELRFRWELPRNSWIEGSYSRAKFTNVSHVSGQDETTNAFRVVARIDF